MKLRKDDMVVVLRGRDAGKAGKVLQVVPKDNKVVVEGINIAKRHTKPSAKHPRGGIIELTKAIDVSKVMALDPKTGKPSRIAYEVTKAGKQRVFKPTKRAAVTAKPKATTDKPKDTKKDTKADAKKAGEK